MSFIYYKYTSVIITPQASDPTAKILIIGEEERPPYMRPPLSKELWFVNDEQAKQELRFKQWNGKEKSLLYEPMPFYTPVKELEEAKNGGISVATGRRVVKIDATNQIAHLEDGATVKYVFYIFNDIIFKI